MCSCVDSTKVVDRVIRHCNLIKLKDMATASSQPRPDFSDTSAERRANMAAISGKNTQPELLVRSLVHGMGYRYRIHVRGLPGRPDLVFASRRKIIEVRGCFWHRHPGCVYAATPRTRTDFWRAKFEATVARDACNIKALEASGWSVMVVWECQIADIHLAKRLQAFLGRTRSRLDKLFEP